jgi:hypothetical protein
VAQRAYPDGGRIAGAFSDDSLRERRSILFDKVRDELIQLEPADDRLRL